MNNAQIFAAIVENASKCYDDATGAKWQDATRLVDEAAMFVVQGKISMLEAEKIFSKHTAWNVTKGQLNRRVNALSKR